MDKIIALLCGIILLTVNLTYGKPTIHRSQSQVSCDKGPAIYNVTINTFWSEKNFPKQYPHYRPNAQWSQLVGRTHSNEFTLFRIGEFASTAIQELAELGKAESLSEQTQGEHGVFDVFRANNIAVGVGRSWSTVIVDSDHSKLSAVSKMIPSPDWFVGIDSLELCTDGQWLDHIEQDMTMLDAGTDKGYTFTAPNWEERPAQPVTEITSKVPNHPANSFYHPELDKLPTMATLTLRKIRDYGAESSIHGQEPEVDSDVSPNQVQPEVIPATELTESESVSLEVEEDQEPAQFQVHKNENQPSVIEVAHPAVIEHDPDFSQSEVFDTHDKELNEDAIDDSFMFQWPKVDDPPKPRDSEASTKVPQEIQTNDLQETVESKPEQQDEHAQSRSNDLEPQKDRPKYVGAEYLFPDNAVNQEPATTTTSTTTSTETSPPTTRARRRHHSGRNEGRHEGRHHDRQMEDLHQQEEIVQEESEDVTPPPIVDCEMGWADWSECSKTCGYGTQRRSYIVLVRPQNGGKPCPNRVRVRDEIQLCGSMSNCEWSHFDFSHWGHK